VLLIFYRLFAGPWFYRQERYNEATSGDYVNRPYYNRRRSPRTYDRP
jgi:hypothetical protein